MLPVPRFHLFSSPVACGWLYKGALAAFSNILRYQGCMRIVCLKSSTLLRTEYPSHRSYIRVTLLYQVTLLLALSINRSYNDCLEAWTRPMNKLHTLGYADISLCCPLLGIGKSDMRRRRLIGRAFTITLTGYIILGNRSATLNSSTNLM